MQKVSWSIGLAVALLVAGCGGGSDSQLTAAEYNDRVASICKQAQQSFKSRAKAAAVKYDGQEISEAKRAEVMATEIALPVMEMMDDGFEELDPPEKGAEKVTALVESLEEATAKGGTDYTGLVDGRLLELPRKRALASGIDECTFF